MVAKKFLFIFALIFITFSLYAQSDSSDVDFFDDGHAFEGTASGLASSENNGEDYYIIETDHGMEFVQKLKWDSSGYVTKYEIRIEKKDEKAEGGYTEVIHQECTTNSLEVRLAAGLYRYRISAYNILGQLEIETQWSDLEIALAYQPSVNNVTPGSVFIEEKPDGVFNLGGRQIQQNAEITLSKAVKGKGKTKKNAKGGKGGYVPETTEINTRGNRARLKFNIDEVEPGKYQILITNPGGLSARSDTITIRYKKPVDFDVSVGYPVHIILFDDTFEKYMKSNVYFLGAAAKANFMFLKRRGGYWGIGAMASYTRMEAQFPTYKITGNFMSGHANAVYQLPLFERRLILEAFIGGGVIMTQDFEFEFKNNLKSPKFNSLYISADAGIAFDIYITKRLFVDVTGQFVYAFMPDISFGMVNPSLSIGWQF